MTLVVDASVAMKWLVRETGWEQAQTLLQSGEAFEAPELVVAEVCNACWRQERVGLLSSEQYVRIASSLPGFFSGLWPVTPLAPRAAMIARTLDHPVYDCFYLALAEQVQAMLVTADRRLVEKVAASPWRGLVRDLYALEAK